MLSTTLEKRPVEEQHDQWIQVKYNLIFDPGSSRTMPTNVLTYEDCVSCLSSSPKDLLVGLYTGHVILDDMSRRSSIRLHKNPCRVAIFHNGQSKIVSGSSKGYLGIVDVEMFKLEKKIKVRNSAISAILSLDTHKIVCADDDGGVFAYDMRTRTDEPVAKFLNIHDDQVIKVLKVQTQNTILSISGNGTLSMIDTKKWVQLPQTMDLDEEISSCCPVHSPHEQSSERVLLATDSGSLVWFDWYSREKFVRNNNSERVQVNAMISIDTETVLLGCESGSVYSMNVDSGFKSDPTPPLHSIDGSVENVVFLSDMQTVGISTMDKCVHTFTYATHQPNLESSQPRNFFDDLME